jgi:CRP-like cAMP-binding protein
VHPDLEQLRSIRVFAALPDEDLERMAEWFEVERHAAGQTIVGEGRAGYAFFVIASGMVTVRRDGETVDSMGPGEFFGEQAILGEGRRRADVVATTPLTVLSMFGTHFRELQAQMPELAAQIEATAKERGLQARG